MRRPNFFIVGAPKCGTTSMYEYLSQHPEIFMPERKEPHFFATDLDWTPGWGVREEAEYLSLFSEAKSEPRVGEASTWYLYSTQASSAIREFNPSARIIAMLRNPVDLIFSLHAHNIRNDDDDIRDLRGALEAEEDRRNSRRIPRGAPFPQALYYRSVPRYSNQLRRYLDLFGPENVHVIIFDDFIKDTANVYRRTLEFLGVDPDFQATFEVYNAVMPKWLSKTYRALAGHPRLHEVTWKALPVSCRQRARRLSTWMSRPFRQRTGLDPELRQTLQDEFVDEVDELSDLLHRDLTHWCRGA